MSATAKPYLEDHTKSLPEFSRVPPTYSPDDQVTRLTHTSTAITTIPSPPFANLRCPVLHSAASDAKTAAKPTSATLRMRDFFNCVAGQFASQTNFSSKTNRSQAKCAGRGPASCDSTAIKAKKRQIPSNNGSDRSIRPSLRYLSSRFQHLWRLSARFSLCRHPLSTPCASPLRFPLGITRKQADTSLQRHRLIRGIPGVLSEHPRKLVTASQPVSILPTPVPFDRMPSESQIITRKFRRS